jgi:hypothetical protein
MIFIMTSYIPSILSLPGLPPNKVSHQKKPTAAAPKALYSPTEGPSLKFLGSVIFFSVPQALLFNALDSQSVRGLLGLPAFSLSRSLSENLHDLSRGASAAIANRASKNLIRSWGFQTLYQNGNSPLFSSLSSTLAGSLLGNVFTLASSGKKVSDLTHQQFAKQFFLNRGFLGALYGLELKVAMALSMGLSSQLYFSTIKKPEDGHLQSLAKISACYAPACFFTTALDAIRETAIKNMGKDRFAILAATQTNFKNLGRMWPMLLKVGIGALVTVMPVAAWDNERILKARNLPEC